MEISDFVLGLFGGSGTTLLAAFLRRRQKPRLSIVPVEHLYFTRIDGSAAAFARLEIRNAPGKESATGVAVRIERATSESEDDRASLAFLEGWQLAWANDDRGDTNVPPRAKAIGPDSALQVDLAHLNQKLSGSLIVDIRPQPGSRNHMNRLGRGTFEFDLALSGDNSTTRRFRVTLAYDGEPWDGASDTAIERIQLTGA